MDVHCGYGLNSEPIHLRAFLALRKQVLFGLVCVPFRAQTRPRLHHTALGPGSHKAPPCTSLSSSGVCSARTILFTGCRLCWIPFHWPAAAQFICSFLGFLQLLWGISNYLASQPTVSLRISFLALCPYPTETFSWLSGVSLSNALLSKKSWVHCDGSKVISVKHDI